jgi:hypothetical protein
LKTIRKNKLARKNLIASLTANAKKLGLTIGVTDTSEVSPLQATIRKRAATTTKGLTRTTKNLWNSSALADALFDYFTANAGFEERNKDVIRNHKRRLEERPEKQFYSNAYDVPNPSFCRYVLDAEFISTQSLLTFPWTKEVFLTFVEMRSPVFFRIFQMFDFFRVRKLPY